MDTWTGFQAGANLGGWLSQYRRRDNHHFASFIREADIQRIAGWGMDHVRLPVDYPVLEDDRAPFVYRESGLAWIDACLEWCQAAGLKLILDLHRAPGFTFSAPGESRLFERPRLQERFLRLWEALATHYLGRSPDGLVFELMNEVVLPSSEPWNALARRAVERIRAIDPDRWIMIGSNRYNSAWMLKDLERLPYSHLVYTFHFYEPMPFTHQKAHWVESLKTLNQSTPYPGLVPGLDGFLQSHPEYRTELERFLTTPMDEAYLRAQLKPALDFAVERGLPLYCGEFGAIDLAPLSSRLAWHRDICRLLNQAGIGHAVWSYKEMGFSLVHNDGSLASQELIEIVSQHAGS